MDYSEGNRLIANFMGRDIDNYPLSTLGVVLSYHKSWDWLMPVVEKIVSSGLIAFQLNIYTANKEIRTNAILLSNDNYAADVKQSNFSKSAINDTYNVVIEVIKWYNKQ